MRQHPIPQNVLDVEFKLFTRFTLREFAFLAIGVGSGGLFLYLTSKGFLPGIIGVPLFLFLSAIGAFFALIPINDQPAHRFIINYFKAINRPTQRVWLNKKLKEQRAKPFLTPVKEKSKIIGGIKVKTKEEEEVKEEDADIFIDEKSKNKILETEIKEDTGPKPLNNEDNLLIITQENIGKYQFPIKSVDKLPGNINIWLTTKGNKPMANINTYLKDGEGKILYANRTGPNGYFLTNKMYPEGIYHLEFEGDKFKGSNIKIEVSKDMSKLPLKISSR